MLIISDLNCHDLNFKSANPEGLCEMYSVSDSYDAAQIRADRARFQSDVGTEASDEDESVTQTQSRKRRLICIFGFWH